VIFPSSAGAPIHPRNLLLNYGFFLQRAGFLKLLFRDLRYTFTSLMLGHVLSLIVVSGRLV
jgi:hypothetical protein